MSNIYETEDTYFDQWKKSGIYEKMQSAWNSASKSGRLNEVQAPQLLKQWIEKGGDPALVEDKSNDAKISSTIIMKKLANYLAIKQDEAERTGNQNISIEAKSRVGQAIGALTSYSKDSHSQFMQTLGEVSGFDKDLNYTTFGEQTDYDTGIQEDTSAIERATQTAGDMSLIASAKRGMLGNRKDEIERSINNELLRRGAVDEGFIEKASGVVGGLILGTIDSIILSKIGGSAGKKIASKVLKKTVSELKNSEVLSAINAGQDVSRYLGQGVILPVVQSLQDQAGLTEKYDDGSGYMKLAGDALQNTASMMVGDKLVSPLLSRFKNDAMVKISKNYTKESIDEAIKAAKASGKDVVKTVEGLLRVKDNEIIKRYIDQGGDILEDNLGKMMQNAIYSSIASSTFKPMALFGAELGSDLVFDIATSTAMDMAGDGLLTVHQTGMYSIPEIREGGDWKGAMQNLLMQRLGMKVAGRGISLAQAKMSGSSDKGSDIGTVKDIKQELGLNKLTPTQTVMMRINNVMFGNDMADLDNYIRQINPNEGLKDQFSADGSRFEGSLASWMYSKYANDKIAGFVGQGVVKDLFSFKNGVDIDKLNKIYEMVPEFARSTNNYMNDYGKVMQGAKASHIEFEDGTKIKSTADKFSKWIADGLAVNRQADENGQQVFSIETTGLNNAINRLSTLLGTFKTTRPKDFDDFKSTVLEKVSGIVSGKASDLNRDHITGALSLAVGLKNIKGSEKLNVDNWSKVELKREDMINLHSEAKGILEAAGVKSTLMLDDDAAHNTYSMISAIKAGLTNPAFVEQMKDIDTYSRVLPKSVALDYQNIKDMAEMLKKNFDETVADTNHKGQVDEVRNVNKLFAETSKRLIKSYSDKLFTLSKNRRHGETPTDAESNQVVAYTLKLLNLAERVSLDDDGRNQLTNLKKNTWIQSALKNALSKNSRVGDLVNNPEIKTQLGEANGFDNIISKIVNLSSSVGIANRIYAGHYLNASKIDSVIQAWDLGVGNNTNINRVVSWLADFSMNITTENGLIDRVSLDGSDHDRTWVTRFNKTWENIYNNNMEGVSDDDVRHAYAFARAKDAVRNAFASANIGKIATFKSDIAKQGVKMTVVGDKVSFDVTDKKKLSLEEMRLFIASKSVGPIITPTTPGNNVMNDSFDINGTRYAKAAELYDKMKYAQLEDINIEGVMLSLVKMYAFDPTIAKTKMKEFMKKLDKSFETMSPESEKELDRFISQQHQYLSTINSFGITWEVLSESNPYAKNAVLTFDNQQSYLSYALPDRKWDVVNIAFSDDFIQKIGSDKDTKAWNEFTEKFARRGFFPVVKKGNTMEWMFLKIHNHDGKGIAKLDDMVDALATRLKSNLTMLTDMHGLTPTDAKAKASIDRMNKAIADLVMWKGQAIDMKDFAKSFLKEYASLLQTEYEVKDKANVVTKDGKNKDVVFAQDKSAKKEEVYTASQISNIIKNVSKDAKFTAGSYKKIAKIMDKEILDMIKNKILPDEDNIVASAILKLNNAHHESDMDSLREAAGIIAGVYENNQAMLSKYNDDLGALLNKLFSSGTENAEHYVDMAKKISTDNEGQAELLKFIMFGDSYIAEAGHITKRFSYSNKSAYINADGSWASGSFVRASDQKRITYEEFFKEMAKKYKVVFASLGGDGLCYFPRKMMDDIAANPGNTQGKLVTNHMFGGMKINAEYSDRLLDSMAEKGTSDNGIDLKDAIIIDVTAFKTMLPLSANALDQLSKGNRFVEADLAPEGKAKFIASMTLHSPIETIAKSKGEFGLAVMTPMHSLNKAIGRAHMVRMARALKAEKDMTIEQFLDPALIFGSWRKMMATMNMGINASSKVSTWHGVTNKDSNTYSEANRKAVQKFADKHYAPEMVISSDLIASFMQNAKSSFDNDAKFKGKSYVSFWSNMTKDDSKMKDHVNTLKKTTWDPAQGLVKNGKVVNGYSIKDYASEDDAYKAMYDQIGNETLELLSKGDDAAFQVYEVNGKKIYMSNVTRFPNERMGQNFSVIVSGISSRIAGVEISDYYYQKIHGGDYDGDTIQIIGLSSKDYKQGVMDTEGKESITDHETFMNILNNHAKAVISKENTIVPKMSSSDFEGTFTQPGGFVSKLMDMVFYESVLNMSKNTSNVSKAAMDEWNKRLSEIFKSKVEGEREIFNISHMQGIVDNSNDERKVAFIYSDKQSLWDNMKISHVGNNAFLSKRSEKINGMEFMVMTADGTDSNGYMNKIAYTVLVDKRRDFPSMKVVSARPLNSTELAAIATSRSGKNQMILDEMGLADAILIKERALIEKFVDKDNIEIDWNKFNETLQSQGRSQLPEQFSFVSKEMMTQLANGVGVDNMKNNTLVFLLDKIAKAGNNNAISDLLSKMTVAMSLKSYVGNASKSMKLVGGVGLLDAVFKQHLPRIDMNGMFDSVVSTVRDLADSGTLFNRMSKQDFDNTKKLFTKIPDANEMIDGFRSLDKLMVYIEGDTHAKDIAKLPMHIQAGLAKFGPFLKGSTVAGSSEVMGKINSMMDTDLYNAIKGDAIMDKVFASKTITAKDLLGDGQDVPEREIRNPIQYLYSFKSMKDMLKKYNMGLFDGDDIAKSFRIQANQTSMIKSIATSPDAFLGEIARMVNELTGRRLTSVEISEELTNMRLGIVDGTRRMMTEEALMQSLSDPANRLSPTELAEKIKIANDKGSNVRGYSISDNAGKKLLTLESISSTLSQSLNSKNVSPETYETRKAIVQALVGSMDDNSQRMFGFFANGMTSSIVNKIKLEKLSKQDLYEIIDASITSGNLKRANITEQTNAVRDEMSNSKIKGDCF